jgi:hypothetical protein
MIQEQTACIVWNQSGKLMARSGDLRVFKQMK